MAEYDGLITWVYCDDLETTCSFYGETLGLPLWRDAGAARIYRVEGGMIGVCRAFKDRVIEPRGSMITLLTDNVDQIYARLVQQDAAVDGPPEVLEQFGIYSFFCRDPNGYFIEVQKFLDP
ncbi:VOC family protein [Alisedimentitalea sp. MJ-SS2]|uniref:VOC family protein n=1 Tax=Aliisedimentitalea sp. MJ-SS2 TaxID=3049795 RepID=UPI00290BADDB|nr:VOC family protein [Alisedimentitalea sp. MJ-SS2]MDU8927714.1 VOC family protein [Alisedimentitalea sp. MJ-SS2]